MESQYKIITKERHAYITNCSNKKEIQNKLFKKYMDSKINRLYYHLIKKELHILCWVYM